MWSIHMSNESRGGSCAQSGDTRKRNVPPSKRVLVSLTADRSKAMPPDGSNGLVLLSENGFLNRSTPITFSPSREAGRPRRPPSPQGEGYRSVRAGVSRYPPFPLGRRWPAEKAG